MSLTRVAHEAVSDLELMVARTGCRIEIGELPCVEADEVQIRQLLQNLIDNSMKYRREQSDPSVRVSGQTVGSFCEIIVEDNGIGFDEKYLDRIFKPFQRLHGRNIYEGTGMGLAICRKIVERHRGSITARSTPGSGITFIVQLPVRQFAEEEIL